MPGMKGFKYVYSPKHISDVLQKMRSTGRPDALTADYMKKTWLLSNAQYGAVLDILKDMGFLEGNKPSALYGEYQNEQKSKAALGKGVRNAYPELFKAYPQAQSLDKKTLEGYFREHSGVDQSVLEKMVATFQRLCLLAEFTPSAGDGQNKPPSGPDPNQGRTEFPFQVTMNIQIVLPSNAGAEEYDRIFSSMKKHLLTT